MKAILICLGVIIKHKWFILLAGSKLNVSWWRLITHDLSKFRLDELLHYARSFYGKKDQPEAWACAWTRHQNRNDHHWEYWIPRSGGRGNVKPMVPIEMPEQAVREMVADWIAASRAYVGKWPTKSNWWWWQNKYPNIILHERTRQEIDKLLEKWFNEER